MIKKEIKKRLLALIKLLGCNYTGEDKEEDMFDTLRFLIIYLLLDSEASKRERDYLEKQYYGKQ